MRRNIGSEGAKHIGEALKINQNLTHLECARCQAPMLPNVLALFSVGALAPIAPPCLVLTDLRNNDIGAEGTKHISEALNSNKALTTL
jgi:hypothetical protein